jgi:hypothetical protein
MADSDSISIAGDGGAVGLLLTFSGDVVTLVLIRGSNLATVSGESGINLTDRAFQRHRITYARKMDENELRKAKQGEPTTDRIEVGEFETREEAGEWINKTAPLFLPKQD